MIREKILMREQESEQTVILIMCCSLKIGLHLKYENVHKEYTHVRAVPEWIYQF